MISPADSYRCREILDSGQFTAEQRLRVAREIGYAEANGAASIADFPASLRRELGIHRLEGAAKAQSPAD